MLRLQHTGRNQDRHRRAIGRRFRGNPTAAPHDAVRGRILQSDVEGFTRNVMAGAVQTQAQKAKAPAAASGSAIRPLAGSPVSSLANTSNEYGASLRLVAVDSGTWRIESMTGTWA